MANDVKNITGGTFGLTADEFKVASPQSLVCFDMQEAMPPEQAYVDVNDKLQVNIFPLFNNVNVVVNVRLLRPDGVIVPLSYTVNSAGQRTLVQNSFQLEEGFLLSVNVNTTAATNDQNPIFSWVSLIRNPGTLAAQYFLLCSGYPTQNCGFGWPMSVPMRSYDGPGWPLSGANLAIGAPAAGADWVLTIPGQVRARIVSISGVLVASATVANRNVDLFIDDGANIYAQIPSGFSQVASATQQYTWMDSGPVGTPFDARVILPLPANLILPPGHRIRTATSNLQAGDQWGNLFAFGQVWADIG